MTKLLQDELKRKKVKPLSDWTGNKNSLYMTLGASNHTDKEREQNDYYATEPYSIDVLFSEETFVGNIWECACGEGHLSQRMEELGCGVISTDLINRGFGEGGVDFLQQTKTRADNIITNPPYKYGLEFCEHAYSLVPEGGKVAMFLKLQFLEGKKRKKFFIKNPPKTLYVSSSRLQCAKNGDFDGMKAGGGSAVAFGWFVWEKGSKTPTVIKWVN